MNGAENVLPLTLTPASRSVGSSGGGGGGSPRSTTSKSVISGDRLMMSGGMELEVQYFDNSKLRATVEELSELVRIIQRERDELLQQVSDMEDTILTFRGGNHIPKIDLSTIRQQVSLQRTESSNYKKQIQSLTSQNTSLLSELRKQTQTVIAKDALLKARARSISSYQQQNDELQTQFRIRDETNRADSNENASNKVITEGHVSKIKQQYEHIQLLQRELEECKIDDKQRSATITDLRTELTNTQDQLRHFTTSSVEQNLLNGFDSAIEMSEKNQRELAASLREAKSTISMLKAENTSLKNMSVSGIELNKSEERCRAVIQVAKQSKLKQLDSEAMSSRKDIILEECRAHVQYCESMADWKLVQLLSGLRSTFEKNKKSFHNRIVAELKPITDDAYLRGYTAATKKSKSRKRPTSTATSSNILSGGNSSTDFTSASLDDQLTLFENVLKRASAKQVAQCLLRCGLKVCIYFISFCDRTPRRD